MTGRLQKKNDLYYIVIQMKDIDGQRKQKWISTGLPVKGNKARAAEELRKVLDQYEKGNLIFSPKTSFVDVLADWLDGMKLLVEPNTYTNMRLCFGHI